MNFSNLYRRDFIRQLSSQSFDLLVIGGGITGCGIALDAALRGMKVALIEKSDFASGTSSRSSKLIHGGLRYLKNFELNLVRHVGRERAVVHRNARHIVCPEKMMLPLLENGSLGKFPASIGLFVYDLLAGVKKEEWRKILDKHETLKAEPLLNGDKLQGSGLYFEYRTDDSRLVIEVAKSAHYKRATLLNYAEAKNFRYDQNKKVTGVTAHDRIGGNDFEIRAKIIVNACGAWVDLLRKEDNSLQGKRLLLTKGVHIVFPQQKLPLRQSVYFDAGDGRMIFAIPRGRVTYVGTTDTVYNKDIDKPLCKKEDALYLLNAANKMFPSVNLKLEDVESSWAGLRPLIFEDGKSPSELSRKDEIIISPTGLISIAGGKLTGYRLMAEKIVDLATAKIGAKFKTCTTKNFRLSGGEFENEKEFNEARREILQKGKVENITEAKTEEWFFRYGKNTYCLIENLKSLKSKITDDEKILDSAEALYGVEHEMVHHLTDYMIRRTGKLFFDRRASEAKTDDLNKFFSEQFQWNSDVAQKMLAETNEEFSSAVDF